MPNLRTILPSLILMVAGTSAGAAPDALPNLIGHYRVTGVAVSNDGVQALSDNDPSLMGKELTLTPARLAFDRSNATDDACVGPRLTRLAGKAPTNLMPQLRKLGMRRPVAYAIQCRSGRWGPDDGTLYVGRAGAIAMPWYDGGILRLVRR